MVPTHGVNINNAAFWLLALGLLLLPVGLGGTMPLSFGAMQIALGLFFLGYAATEQTPLHIPQRLTLALVLLTIVIGWGFVQTLSITPAAWHHPLWAEATAALPQLHGSISLTPAASLLALQRLITYVLITIAVALLASDPTIARRLITMLWIVGVALCTLALISHWIAPDRLLWLAKETHLNDVTGTFINRNHFADYAGLTFITGVALAWQSARSFFRGVKPHQYAGALQQWMVRQGLPFFLMLGIVAAALLLSHSRAGLVCTLLALAVFTFSFLLYQRRIRTALLMTLAVAAVAAALLLAMADTGRMAQLFSDYSSQDRMKIYALTTQAIANNPWFGHGLGSFESAFRLYRDTSIMWGQFTINAAHSDWLEAAFDLGIPAALLLALALALVTSSLWHGIRTRHKDGIYPALGLAACALIFTHTLVDFSLQIPGVVVSWLILLGCGLAQSWRRTEMVD